MLLPDFCPQEMSTAMHGQPLPADQRESVFLLELGRHGVICTSV